jgi:allantoin racemase
MAYRIGVIGTGAGIGNTSVPPAPIAELASEGFAPELIETRLRTFPMTPYDRGLTVLAYVDCAIEAEKAGFDAVFINTVGDYGIDEMRSATSMVVVGAGEATMAMSCNTGRRFSIVTIWPPKLNFIYQERLRSTGMEARCASVRHVLSDAEVEGLEGAGAAVTSLKDGNASIVDRVMEQIEKAIHEDGADTIMFGCTCMAPIGPLVAERSPVPVLESMRTGYKTVEAMLALGIKHSHTAYPKADPSNLDAVGALVAGQGDLDLGGDCEVCVIAQEAAE